MFSRSPPSQDPEKVSASSKCDIEIKSTCGKKEEGRKSSCVCVCVLEKWGPKRSSSHMQKKKKKQPSSGGSTMNNAYDSEENVIDVVIRVLGILFPCHLCRRHFCSTL